MAIPIDDEILALKNRLGELRKEKKREYLREYSQRPEVQKKRGEYFRRPKVKEKQREYQREYFQRPEVKLAAKLRRNGIPEEVIKAELSRLKEAAE